MRERHGYWTDPTDEQWALIEPVILAWKATRPSASGHTGNYSYRDIYRAIVYQNRTGCPWSLLPNDLPPEGAVRYYFYTWRDCGLEQTINEILRCQVREKAGRTEDPSLAVIDTQSLHNSVNVPASTTGRDPAKKVPGRKHGIAIDILGLITAVVITAASAHENTVGKALITQIAATTPSISKILIDQGFKTSVVTHGAEHGMNVEIVERNPEPGFHPQPIRWRVEQVPGTLMLQRRLVRDYESDPRSTASRIYWASILTMTKHLTGTTTPTWRGT